MPKGKNKMKQVPPSFTAALTMAGESATIDIKGIIGWHMSPTEFTDLVDEAKASGATKLLLRINSVGGYCLEGLAMGDCLRKCGMETTGLVVGTAQSMASYLLQCCDKRLANAHALLMFHQPSAGAYGTVDEIMEQAKHLVAMRDEMFEFMGKRCGMSGEELSKQHMSAKQYNAKAAIAKGFLDGIDGEEEGETEPPPADPAEPDDAPTACGLVNYDFMLAAVMQGEESEDDEEEGEKKPEPAPKKSGDSEEKTEPKPKKDEEDDGEKKPDEEEKKPEARGGMPAQASGAEPPLTRAEVARMIAQSQADTMASMGMPASALPGAGPANPAAVAAAPTPEQFAAMSGLEKLEAAERFPHLAAIH